MLNGVTSIALKDRGEKRERSGGTPVKDDAALPGEFFKCTCPKDTPDVMATLKRGSFMRASGVYWNNIQIKLPAIDGT